MKISSRRGPTTPSAILPGKPSISVTKPQVRFGVPPRCRYAMKLLPTWRATARAIADSITDLTEFCPSCCNSCPLQTRSRFPASRLKNNSGRVRRLSITGYAEWVLGSSRSASAPYLVTELDSKNGSGFREERVGRRIRRTHRFRGSCRKQTSVTGDRTEFLGRNGTLERPAALEQGARFPATLEQASIHARPYKPSLSCVRVPARKSCSFSARRKIGSRRANCWAAIAPQT